MLMRDFAGRRSTLETDSRKLGVSPFGARLAAQEKFMNSVLSSSDEGRISQHTNRLVAPDVIYMRVVGDLSEEDGHVINRQHYELGKDVDGLFFICDISELESVTSATRKEAVEIQKNMV